MTNRFACRLNAVFFASFAIAAPALAAPGDALPDDPENDEIVFADARGPDAVYSYGFRERKADEVGSAVTLITADDIAALQIVFAADALKAAPGVALARNGAYGGFASARIRGGSSGQTVVVIDGVVANDAAAPQGGFNFANLDAADIERIEVLRGPQSLVWGADAIGGVISITTKSQAPAASLFAEGGSRGTFRGGASLFHDFGGGFARATVSGLTSDGVSRAASGTEKDGYRSIAASLAAGADLGASTDLRVTARVNDSHADIDGFPPPFFTFGDTAETEEATEYAFSARLAHRADRYQGAATLGYSAIDRANRDAGVETFDAEGRRLSASYWGSLALSERISVEAGGEAERLAARVSGVDETAHSGAVFALLEARPADALVISAGARRDEFSNFDGATTMRVAGAWTIDAAAAGTTTLRASWGEGFRAPTLFELNFDQFGIVPNPDLRPERATGFDFGVEQSLANASFRATYFRQRVRDQIDFDFGGNGYFNIDRVKSRGVEIEAQANFADIVSARVVYSYIDARDALTGARILRTPKHSGAVTLAAQVSDALNLSATATFNGREDDFPAPNAAFEKLDLRAAYAVSDRLELYGRIENATDEEYEDVSGFGEPGRSAFAGVRVRL